MTYLFDIGHPAHVHLFRYFIKYLQKNGHKVIVTSRKKDITEDLLNYYKIDHVVLSKPRKSLLGMALELLWRDLRLVLLHLKYNFDASFGTSVNIPHLTLFFGVPSYSFNEDDDAVVPLYVASSYPFATKIIVPKSLKYKYFKKKRVLHESSHKLAYLHPNHFKPNVEVLKKYNLEPKKYVIVRNSALGAHHDIGAKGLNKNVWNEILELVGDYKLVKSMENEKSHQIDPWDMHHVMAFAKLMITDSQSMTMESAILGVPVIRYNTFVNKISYLDEIENKYKLSFGFTPGEEEKMYNQLKLLLKTLDLETKWQQKKEVLLKEKGDFTDWMINYYKNYIL